MTNLLLPAFISYAPPEHTITSILLVEKTDSDKSFVVTGSQTGNVCIWNYERGGNQQLSPRILMPSQEQSPVVALAFCSMYDWRESIVSVTEDGTVAIFSAQDGQCLAVTRAGAFKCEPVVAVLLKGKYLAAGGKTSELEVMDINTRKIVRRIHSHQTWIRDMICCTIDEMEAFATLSAAGFVRFFGITDDLLKPKTRIPNLSASGPVSQDGVLGGSLGDSEGDLRSQNSDDDCVPIQQFALDINDAQKIAVSPDNQMLLVVGVQQWVLFSLRSFRHMTEGQVPDSFMGISCDFLTSDSFVIWSKRGKGFVFKIPDEILAYNIRTTTPSTPPKNTSTENSNTNSFSNLPAITLAATTTASARSSLAISQPAHKDPSPSGSMNTFPMVSSSPKKAVSQRVFARRKEMEDTTDDHDVNKLDFNVRRIFSKATRLPTEIVTSPSGTFSLKLAGKPVRFVDHIHVSYSAKSVVVAFNEGYLSVWDKSKLKPDPSISALEPHSMGSFASGWPVNSSSPLPWHSSLNKNTTSKSMASTPSSNAPTAPSSPSSANSPDSKPLPLVSATLLLEREFILLNGYSDGTMCIRNLPFDAAPIKWQAHDSKINSIITLNTTSGNRYIITGSDDYYVKVWAYNTQKLVSCFACHSGKVIDIFPAWKSSAPKYWMNKFFSVGSDHCVVLYQLDSDPPIKAIFGTHSSDIKGVKWNFEQDYLMVECADGSMSLWEMETGELEQCLYGRTAQEIFSNAEHLAKATKLQKLKDFNQFPVTSLTVDGKQVDHVSPVQCIVLNVKNLATELAKQLEQFYGASTGSAISTSNDADTKHNTIDEILSAKGIQSTAPVINALPAPNTTHTSNASATTTASIPLIITTPTPHHSTNNPDATTTTATKPLSTSTPQHVFDLPNFRAFSYFLPWGFDPALDSVMTTELSVRSPSPHVTYGLMGTSGRMSMLVPGLPPNARWTTSATLTALHALSASALSKILLVHGTNANVCSQILSYMCALIPEKTAFYVDPSLSFLARYWQDQMEDVMHSARAIFMSVIDRLKLPERKDLTQTWSRLLEGSADTDANRKSKSLAVLVLGIIGSERPDSLTPDISTQVTMAIMDLLFQESSAKLRVAAVELLGKGFGEWSKHIEDVNQVIQKLFKLSILNEPKTLTNTAHHALMLIGAREPLKFLRAVGRRFQSNKGKNNTSEDPGEHAQALTTIGALVKKNPASLLGVLPLLVDSVVRSLDPHVPYLRNACLKSATALVHDLVRRYPMVAFHQQTQRLAVGTKDGLIFIYDLISATRWFTLEGHKCEVTAVAFEPEGNYLSSYSIDECLIKIWKTSNSFFGILGSNPSCAKTIRVSRSSKSVTPALLLEPAVKLQWTDSKEFLLIRTWEPDDQRILTLKRDK